ncbi:MAG: bifunctional riboflavin kinase/FAD synthetase [Planctomycetes bacterium]|nr:bifunctional riboflavin kinase/FAD synthetase [Planctomycetota bacterium]
MTTKHFRGLPQGRFASLPSPVVTFGVFDGVHLGHQAVLKEVAAWAKELHGTAVALTFDRHPQTVLRGAPVPSITSIDHRLLLMERAGADLTIVLPFTVELARLSPAEFLDMLLVRELHARGLVLGFDQRFGHHAAGDFAMAKAWGEAHGVEVRRGPEVVRAGSKVGSSAIRMAIAGGRLDDAAAMMGRPASLYGTVVKGDGRGRTINVPTANLDPHHELVPPRGVYLTTTTIDGKPFRAVVNIGVRPTFGGGKAEVVEAHILDFSGDLYGRDLELQFVRKLRDEKKFDSAEALVAQIRADIAEARKS